MPAYQSEAWAIGAEIRRRRRALALTAKEVGERIGVAQPTITKWENGPARPEERYFDKIAEFLEVDRDEVIRLSFKRAEPEADHQDLIAAMGPRWSRLTDAQRQALLRQIDETLGE